MNPFKPLITAGKAPVWSIIAASFLAIFPNSQNNPPQTKILAKFIITEAKISGVDWSSRYFESKSYLAFYLSEGKLCMSNVNGLSNSQSFGYLYPLKVMEQVPPTDSTYTYDYVGFRWNYYNNYNSNNGWATVVFWKIYKPQGVAFVLRMSLADLELYEFKGYMEGTLDFKKYQ